MSDQTGYDKMDPTEQADRVFAAGGPDVYFVIAGKEHEFHQWAGAFMTMADMEHRIDHERSRSRTHLEVFVTPYKKFVRYEYLSRVDGARGRGKFLVINIGTFFKNWSRRDLDLLSQMSQASFR